MYTAIILYFFSETAALNHFILYMHISLHVHVGGLLMIVEMIRGHHTPLENYGGFV